MSDQISFRIAIVGFGPRGLGALEALCARVVETHMSVHVDIYDPFPHPGAGPNFDPEQSELCILNIPVRILDYIPPDFMADRIPTFIDWAADRFTADEFPPRSVVGTYLTERFQALLTAVPDHVTIQHHRHKVVGLESAKDEWCLSLENGQNETYSEVLLAQGQPDTAPDPQLDRWETHAQSRGLEVCHAYPASQLMEAAKNWSDKTVAVRGLGLSTLDVLRMLTKGMGGTFEGGGYTASGREPRKILPFSLNGKAPVAKPATKVLDDRFNPIDTEIAQFVAALETTLSSGPDEALRVICDALIAPATRILDTIGGSETRDDVELWLEIERKEPGGQDVLDAVDALRLDIDIAHGRVAPTAGYVIGQVWRKLQGELRKFFNKNDYTIDTAVAMIGFDEALKRYSYGPPVFAAEELLALIEHGIVSLCIVDDPAVVLKKEGWQLIEEDDAMSAQVMVDAVIPSPALANVRDDLMSSIAKAELAVEVEDGMGAKTGADAQLIDVSGQLVEGLTLLGRLSLGSVIAVDGLDDCFGSSTGRWAEGVINRMGGPLT